MILLQTLTYCHGLFFHAQDSLTVYNSLKFQKLMSSPTSVTCERYILHRTGEIHYTEWHKQSNKL